jgi:hypothetical protein
VSYTEFDFDVADQVGMPRSVFCSTRRQHGPDGIGRRGSMQDQPVSAAVAETQRQNIIRASIYG